MGLLANRDFNSLKVLFIEMLKDSYDAEQRLVEALPKMVDAATSTSLKNVLREHLDQTLNHVSRLEQVFNSIGVLPERETCQGMKGLISEGSEVIGSQGDRAVRDAALIAAAQRLEHYEIAIYGSTCTFAAQLGFTQAVDLLQSTLEEEKAAYRKLTELATEEINDEALRSSRSNAAK
jgi:ferritin-like metal-binding protein YciE